MSTKRSLSSGWLSNFLNRKNVVYLFLLLSFCTLVLRNFLPSSVLLDTKAPTRSPIIKGLPPTAQVCGAGILEQPWTNATTLDSLIVNPACAQPSMMVEPVPVKPEKVVTFFIIYYNNADFLAEQIDSWNRFSESAKQRTQFLIIDDGSALGFRATDFLTVNSAAVATIDLQVYEIDQDLAWNIGGARNLGLWVAPTEWVFLSDSDILVRPTTMDFVLEMCDRSTPQTIFRKFHRVSTDGKAKPHPAVMLITKKSYWKAGACDEDFIGNYGYTDVHFFHRAGAMLFSLKIESIEQEMRTKLVAPLEQLLDKKNCPPGLNCLTQYQGAKLVKDASINKILMKQKIMGHLPWSQEYLRFTWRRVF